MIYATGIEAEAGNIQAQQNVHEAQSIYACFEAQQKTANEKRRPDKQLFFLPSSNKIYFALIETETSHSQTLFYLWMSVII